VRRNRPGPSRLGPSADQSGARSDKNAAMRVAVSAHRQGRGVSSCSADLRRSEGISLAPMEGRVAIHFVACVHEG